MRMSGLSMLQCAAMMTRASACFSNYLAGMRLTRRILSLSCVARPASCMIGKTRESACSCSSEYLESVDLLVSDGRSGADSGRTRFAAANLLC